LKQHPDVVDAVVVGRPSERFGQEVVGIVQLVPGCAEQADVLREWCTGKLARFKAPRAISFVERVERHPSGKANYQWARTASEWAVAAR
jgi:fatty-acyl-CoA synthase